MICRTANQNENSSDKKVELHPGLLGLQFTACGNTKLRTPAEALEIVQPRATSTAHDLKYWKYIFLGNWYPAQFDCALPVRGENIVCMYSGK